MSTVRMPPILRQAVGGAREVDANGATVRELLDDLTSRYPAIRGHLLDDGGELNRFVNVYVNNEDVRLGEGLDTSVTPEATVIVLPAMAGGGALAMACLQTERVAALSAVGQHAAGGAAADEPAGRACASSRSWRSRTRPARSRTGSRCRWWRRPRTRASCCRASGSWSRPAATPASRWP